ncbi:hypothetical protein [Candidatus Poriferisocius sp.]|uniref:hypothetical protein n=1 Tax=Candidatus Poriferisocius sp. TaxID=3101276 RepID=UPI003B020A7C
MLGRVGLVLIAAVLAFSAVAVIADPVAAQQPATQADIAVRDNLIAQQESLLNTYRCRFDIDTHIVPGGCTDARPSQGPTEPDPFEGVPTPAEIAVRDDLIAQQESLLNTYRCRFDIDTHIVPGGCTDGTPATTGPSNQTPSGLYTAVAAGVQHACAIRTDRTISCWGDNESGQASAPDGQFTALAAGEQHVCAIRADQTITCWGDNSFQQASAPTGQFTAISAGPWQTCGLRTDATITCWGTNSSSLSRAPDGQFTAVAAGSAFVCALRTDAGITCWGNNEDGQADAPDGQFTAIAAGVWHACGLRADARVICWGFDVSDRNNAPARLFTAIAVGRQHSCGLRVDGAITCWGDNNSGQARAPVGQFTAIAAHDNQSCGLRTDQTIICWGNNNDPTNPPNGQFTAIAARGKSSCGLRDDAAIACWGNNDHGQANPPDRQFTAIATSHFHSCGLRTDATIACWSLAPVVPFPSGAQKAVQAEPAMCLPHGVPWGVTAGFPLPSWAPSATGTIRVAVLFLDFPDAPATHSTHDEAALGLPWAETYLETVSFGQLNIEFVPLHKWLRAEDSYTNHLGESALGQPTLRDVDKVAVRLADPEFDFTGYDVLMVVMPSSHFVSADAGGSVGTQEGTVSPTSRINISHVDDGPQEPTPWGRSAAHELAHNLGLLDMYPYDDSHMLPDSPVGKAWTQITLGIMGLRAYFLANPRDRRLAHVWHFPSGHTSTDYRYFFSASEMLAWSRWQLGWLNASHIRCVTAPEVIVDLRPIATKPGDGIAMAAIPLSDTEVIVVESRRKTGYDAGRFYRTPDGVTTTLPALPIEGVLVYTVNAAIGSGNLPAKVAGDPGDGQVDDLPILTPGQSVTVRGYTITFQAATPDVHTVAITKAGAS